MSGLSTDLQRDLIKDDICDYSGVNIYINACFFKFECYGYRMLKRWINYFSVYVIHAYKN